MARMMKYNPGFLTEEELVQSFVAHHEDLDLLMQDIRDNNGATIQHVVVIGPRGSGKTTLVLRAVAEVKRDPLLRRRWYPLVFSEESYQVRSVGELWLEAIFHIGQQSGERRWKQAHAELRAETDEGRLRERALGQLMDFADRQQKRILLVVENLNTLLGEQIKRDDLWALRRTLLHERRIMLLATACSRFDRIAGVNEAMFEVFRMRQLPPLGTDDCKRLWASVAGMEPSDSRVRPIQILTGGNPRLLSVIASFASAVSVQELMEELARLIDDHTEYFKSYLDHLAPEERKVYVGLAELWDPSTAREVAEAIRSNVNHTSALLNRLTERGAVTPVGERGRARLYQVTERMYNIYYLMRRRTGTSQRLRAMVDFMAGFYGHPEPTHTAPVVANGARSLDQEQASEVRERTAAYLRGTSPATRQPESSDHVFIQMAACGAGKDALKLLEESSSKHLVEPLIAGIKLHLGQDVQAAVEIIEVAKDIARTIEERRNEMAKAQGEWPHIAQGQRQNGD